MDHRHLNSVVSLAALAILGACDASPSETEPPSPASSGWRITTRTASPGQRALAETLRASAVPEVPWTIVDRGAAARPELRGIGTWLHRKATHRDNEPIAHFPGRIPKDLLQRLDRARALWRWQNASSDPLTTAFADIELGLASRAREQLLGLARERASTAVGAGPTLALLARAELALGNVRNAAAWLQRVPDAPAELRARVRLAQRNGAAVRADLEHDTQPELAPLVAQARHDGGLHGPALQALIPLLRHNTPSPHTDAAWNQLVHMLDHDHDHGTEARAPSTQSR